MQSTPCHKIIIFEISGLANKQHKQILAKLDQLERHMSAIDDRMAAISARVDEAATEIVDLINSLRDETLSEEGRAKLDNIEAKVNALADIVPNPEPPPTP